MANTLTQNPIESSVHEALMMIRGELHYCNQHCVVFWRCGLWRILQSEVETVSRDTRNYYHAMQTVT